MISTRYRRRRDAPRGPGRCPPHPTRPRGPGRKRGAAGSQGAAPSASRRPEFPKPLRVLPWRERGRGGREWPMSLRSPLPTSAGGWGESGRRAGLGSLRSSDRTERARRFPLRPR
ncbi:FAM57A isoform 5 [Pan troglodytes]|nr:FAM57A isoform 5 [Pan troglodytes]